MAYVFGYGSLVDRGSLEASIGRLVEAGDGPRPARLHGYRRCWNVAGPTTVRPEYVFRTPDGAPWQGHLGWLGVEPDAAHSALGALYRVTEPDLAVLDRRELSYDRIDVSAGIELIADAPWPSGAVRPVYTYRPKPAAVDHARSNGPQVTVMARYLRLLERGFGSLGAELYAEHLRTLPDMAPFRVQEITGAPRDPSVRNAAVDPAHDPAPPTGAR